MLIKMMIKNKKAIVAMVVVGFLMTMFWASPIEDLQFQTVLFSQLSNNISANTVFQEDNLDPPTPLVIERHIVADFRTADVLKETTTSTPHSSDVSGGNVNVASNTSKQEETGRNASTSCLLMNSRQWLHSKRFSNIDMSQEEFREHYKLLFSSPSASSASASSASLLLEQNIDTLLRQTLAWPNSRLVKSGQDIINRDITTTATHEDDDPTAVAKRWLTRFSFAIIYRHQHEPARKQWKQMMTMSSRNDTVDDDCLESRLMVGVGRFDWECPQHQKYLAFSQQDQGIGAGADLFRQAIMAGISSQRIVLPINNNDETIGAKKWTMASCQRKDMQCVFAPVSPCALTVDQVNNGTWLQSKGDFQKLYRFGKTTTTDPKLFWQKYENFGLNPKRRHQLFFRRLYQMSQELLEELPANDAARHIWERTSEMFKTNKTMALGCFETAATMYMLRPNTHIRIRLRKMLNRNIPQDLNFDPQKTIGLPIRASDKCVRESSCLSFDDYMALALQTKKKSLPGKSKPFVIVTSEAKEIYDQLRDLMNHDHDGKRYPFRFIMNLGDVQPGSGRSTPNVTADDAMVSAMSSLQLQLGSSVVRANCCSRFHTIMLEFLSVGAGATLNINVQCLNDDTVDPHFRICCWNERSCMEKRSKGLKNQNTPVGGAKAFNITRY